MDVVETNLIVLSLIALANLFIAFILYQHSQGKPANKLFAGVAGSSGLWVAVGVIRYYFYNSVGSAIYPYLFTKFSVVFAVSIFFFFTLFSYSFPSNFFKINKRFLGFLVVLYSAIITLAFIPNAILISEEFVSGTLQPIYQWGELYTYVYTPVLIFFFLLGLIRLLKTYKITARNSVEKNQIHFTLMGCGLGGGFGITFGLLVASYPELVYLFWIGRLSTIIFVGFVAYAILKYQWLNIKVIATELLVFGMLSFILLRTLLVQDLQEQIINGVFFILVVIFGFFLIKSVLREVEQREHIEKLAGELEEANRRQESLLHFIGHEIKGYFTKSHWALSSMIDGDYGDVAPDLKMLTEQALDDTKQGIDMVEGILKAGNLKKGTVSYEMKPFDFKEEVMNVLEKLKSNIDTKKLKLGVHIDERENYTIKGDGEQLSKHVIRNLIDNAIKYTLSGSIVIELSKRNGKILFSVRDSGVGITQEDKKRLFTEGGRGKDSVKVNVHSTGYGLFIAKQVVEAHRGRIWAESEGKGKGSTFFVEI